MGTIRKVVIFILGVLTGIIALVWLATGGALWFAVAGTLLAVAGMLIHEGTKNEP